MRFFLAYEIITVPTGCEVIVLSKPVEILPPPPIVTLTDSINLVGIGLGDPEKFCLSVLTMSYVPQPACLLSYLYRV